MVKELNQRLEFFTFWFKAWAQTSEKNNSLFYYGLLAADWWANGANWTNLKFNLQRGVQWSEGMWNWHAYTQTRTHTNAHNTQSYFLIKSMLPGLWSRRESCTFMNVFPLFFVCRWAFPSATWRKLVVFNKRRATLASYIIFDFCGWRL